LFGDLFHGGEGNRLKDHSQDLGFFNHPIFSLKYLYLKSCISPAEISVNPWNLVF
jgi:hypothetical protein